MYLGRTFLKIHFNSYVVTIVACLTPPRVCKVRRHLKHNIDSFVRLFVVQFWSQSAREGGRFLVLFCFLEAEILRHGPTTSFFLTDFIDTVVHSFT
jgi:hypothetical protein